MVKRLSDLYMEGRKAFAQQEDLQTAGLRSRNLLFHITGKTKEQ